MRIKKEEKTHFTPEPPKESENGTMDRFLQEPVPKWLNRSSDIVFEGHNNTLICLGRDRAPEFSIGDGEKKSEIPDQSMMVSGFSNHQGAGAIDIVVGRGAPFPVRYPKGREKPQAQGPSYVDYVAQSYIGTSLRDDDTHDGTCMDAARIYISQMSKIDNYFDLPNAGKFEPSDKNPSSAIILKADRVRLHSRREVKIISGAQVAVDSNGYAFKDDGAIHLMSRKGGEYADQQPIPLGQNLRECLQAMATQMSDTINMMHKIFLSQQQFNLALKDHIHATGAGPTTPSPPVQVAGFFKDIDDITSQFNILAALQYNIPFAIENTFLEKSAKKSILSPSNTTN